MFSFGLKQVPSIVITCNGNVIHKGGTDAFDKSLDIVIDNGDDEF